MLPFSHMNGRRTPELDLVWNALRDPTRRDILDLLRERPQTVGELCGVFAAELSRFAVMKHLKLLKAADLVLTRRQGRETWNQLNAVPIRRIYERWVTKYESVWAERLLSLERHVSERAQEHAGGQPPTGESMKPPRDGQAEAQAPSGEVETQPRSDEDGTQPRSGTAALDSFRIEQAVAINGPPAAVFAGLLEVDAWWCHRMYDDRPGKREDDPNARPAIVRATASTVILEPFAGGRFYEKSSAGEAHFGTVQEIVPGKLLRLYGPLGMVTAPVVSLYEYSLSPAGADTRLKLVHQAFGMLTPEWRAAHEAGWRELWQHLRAFVESGKRWN